MIEEIWKDIPEYKGLYQVSSLGRVKSLNYNRSGKEKVLIQSKNGWGYLHVTLCNKTSSTKRVHILVAQCFLNHKPNGKHKIVVNHINFDRTDNRVENLELVSQRENANQKHLKSKSQYTGVTWHNKNNKWISRIYINGKYISLGCFALEYDAHLAYEKALKEMNIHQNPELLK